MVGGERYQNLLYLLTDRFVDYLKTLRCTEKKRVMEIPARYRRIQENRLSAHQQRTGYPADYSGTSLCTPCAGSICCLCRSSVLSVIGICSAVLSMLYANL